VFLPKVNRGVHDYKLDRSNVVVLIDERIDVVAIADSTALLIIDACISKLLYFCAARRLWH
jgi:hypothetical protein